MAIEIGITQPTGTWSPINSRHQLAWDSTSLGEFKTCARRYFYRIVMGLTPRDVSAHLTFGLIYHSALETYDNAKAQGSTHSAAVIIALRHTLEKTWDSALGRPWTSDIPTKTRETLVRSILWYLENFSDDPASTIILANGRAAVELSFRFESGLNSSDGQPYLISGHMDRMVNFMDRPWGLDRKTTRSALNSDYATHYSPDNQISLYSVAGSLIFGEPIAGFLIDAAQIGVGFSRFWRFPVTRTQAQLSEWMADLEFWLSYAEHCAKINHWPQNDRACGNFERVLDTKDTSQTSGYAGGCPYRTLCGVSPSARPALYKAYDVSPWDPLIPRGET
jgi:hypothetical protein